MQLLARDKKTGRFISPSKGQDNEFEAMIRSLETIQVLAHKKPATKVMVKDEKVKHHPSRLLFILLCGLAAYTGVRLGLGL